ncbi:MerR family transcriptional regulator [Streptomyces albogriseolus]
MADRAHCGPRKGAYAFGKSAVRRRPAAGPGPAPVADRLDDDHFPAYTMGRAAELVGATPAFLRALGDARLITPMRSDGGHRRYSRHQLRLAARARELVDQGTPVDAACRIVSLEEQLERAEQMNEDLRRQGADPVHGHR